MLFASKRIFLIALLILVGCTDRTAAPVVPQALEVGQPVTVFAGSTRLREADDSFGSRRSETLQHLELTVSVPPEHMAGDLNFGYANPDPQRQFALAARTAFDGAGDFKQRLRAELAQMPRDQREVTVFVHGYNSTQAETAFRAAQLKTDLKVPGALVIYSWPSKGRALAYAYDTDSLLFARDGMEDLLRQVADVGATRVLVVGHSMGGAITMEALRQMDISSPGWPARNLSSVVLISPDLDVEVFRTQMNRLSAVPSPFVIFVSARDAILDVSSRLRGTNSEDRLGSIDDVARIQDLPVEIIDTTQFAKSAGSKHFVPATSPALIAMIRQSRSVHQMFKPNETSLGTILTGHSGQGTTARAFVVTENGVTRR